MTSAHDNLFQYCLENKGANATTIDLLKCYSEQLSHDVGGRQFSRSVLLAYAAALVFFMQAGFAMLCAGAVRKKNVQNTMLKNLMDACGAALAFFMVGYAFAFGGMDPSSTKKTFIGHTNFFLMDVTDYAFWLFQYAFSAASATIVAGTLAERCQMAAYLCYSVMLSGWVYPIIVHAVWNPNGFLAADSLNPLWGVGMVDFAGSGVVHVTGGITALFATIILGPRRGRFHDDTGRRLDVPKEFPGHSVALQMLGTFILWFGWYGFNAGSALVSSRPDTEAVAALAGVNTTLSGGTAGIVALFLNLYILERTTGEAYFDLKYLMNGSLSGLVAITGSCGVVEPWASVVIGTLAGILYVVGSRGLIWMRLDDAVDAIPVHLVNGAWGVLAVGLFASPSKLQMVYGRSDHVGWFYSLFRRGSGDARLLLANTVGLLFIVGWVFGFMFPFFIWLDWKGWFRSDPLEEIVGLDTSYHGGLALLGEEEVNPEYISAFKRRKEEGTLRRRGSRHHFSDTIDLEMDVDQYTEGGGTVDQEQYMGGGGSGARDMPNDVLENGEVGVVRTRHYPEDELYDHHQAAAVGSGAEEEEDKEEEDLLEEEPHWLDGLESLSTDQLEPQLQQPNNNPPMPPQQQSPPPSPTPSSPPPSPIVQTTTEAEPVPPQPPTTLTVPVSSSGSSTLVHRPNSSRGRNDDDTSVTC